MSLIKCLMVKYSFVRNYNSPKIQIAIIEKIIHQINIIIKLSW